MLFQFLDYLLVINDGFVTIYKYIDIMEYSTALLALIIYSVQNIAE